MWKRNRNAALVAGLMGCGMRSSSTVPERDRKFLEGTLRFRQLEEQVLKLEAKQKARGFYSLPDLDYTVANGISPVWSAHQVRYLRQVQQMHHLDTLNKLSLGSQWEGQPLHVVIASTSFDATNSALHTAASEFFNLSFMFKAMKPWGTEVPHRFAEAVQSQFGIGSTHSLEAMEQQFLNMCLSAQKEGWGWLVSNLGRLELMTTESGITPVALDLAPLACINLHHHACMFDYGDHPNGFTKYLRQAFKAIDWRNAADIFELHSK
jgi:Fe-Mn family superoxide dismutase